LTKRSMTRTNPSAAIEPLVGKKKRRAEKRPDQVCRLTEGSRGASRLTGIQKVARGVADVKGGKEKRKIAWRRGIKDDEEGMCYFSQKREEDWNRP